MNKVIFVLCFFTLSLFGSSVAFAKKVQGYLSSKTCSNMLVEIDDTVVPVVLVKPSTPADTCNVVVYCNDKNTVCSTIKLSLINYDKNYGHSLFGCNCDKIYVCLDGKDNCFEYTK